MSYKALSDSLNQLMKDYEAQEKCFLNEVETLNQYDVVIRKAMDKITGLTSEVEELEKEKDRYDYELNAVSSRQKQLEELIADMEKTLQLPDYVTNQQIETPNAPTLADTNRRNILQAQVDIDIQLKQIDDDVTDIVEQFEEFLKSRENNPNGDSDSVPVVEQIRQILLKQMSTLTWVDSQSDVISAKAKKLQQKLLPLQ